MPNQISRLVLAASLLSIAAAACFPRVALATGEWVELEDLATGRGRHSANLLSDGRLLVVGGYHAVDGYLNSAEILDPEDGSWSSTGSLGTARGNFTTTLLPDGRVLAVGGYNGSNTNSVEIWDPATGLWSATDSLSLNRDNHTATLLRDGRVLVTGGFGGNETAEVWDPQTEMWSPVSSMSTVRCRHTATLLQNGRVLVIGGWNYTDFVASAEIWDPVTNAWSLVGSIGTAREGHSATLLPSGKVLVTGGWNGGALAASELWDPATGLWTSAGSLTTARYMHAATLLPDGDVLVIGGFGSTELLSVERWSEATGTWQPMTDLIQARRSHLATLMPSGGVLVTGGEPSTASRKVEIWWAGEDSWAATNGLAHMRALHSGNLLPDGRVMVVGGWDRSVSTTATEFWEPLTGTWTTGAPMVQARHTHTATLLLDGRLLVTGGKETSNGGFTDRVEIWNPVTETWRELSAMSAARSQHTATLLHDGRVLVTGGYDGAQYLLSAQIFSPWDETWTVVDDASTARRGQAATRLLDGRVLIVGGENSSGRVGTAEIWDPVSGSWSSTAPMTSSRVWHTMTLLADGRVLVAGGIGATEALDSAEIWDPVTETWTTIDPMPGTRQEHTATRLFDGRVLIVGGWRPSIHLHEVLLWEPASGRWSVVAPLSHERDYHSATLLSDGRVLVAGGCDGSAITLAEVWTPATTPAGECVPSLNLPLPSPMARFSTVTLTGTDLTGCSEASGGNTYADSSTNFPLVRLASLHDDTLWGPSGTRSRDWSDTETTFTAPPVTGHYILQAVTNAIPSEGVLVRVGVALDSFVKSQGDAQSGAVGSELPLQLVVEARDSGGLPIPHVLVGWTASGDGSVSTSTTSTGPDGRTSVTATLGSAPGPYSFTATAVLDGQSLPVTFTADAGGVPHRLHFSSSPGTTVAGEAISPEINILVHDEFGDLVPTATNEITISLQGAGLATLNGTLQLTAVGGIATFDDLRIDLAGADYVLQADSPGLEGAASLPFSVVHGDPSSITKLSGDQQAGDVGSDLSEPLVVLVADAHGNPVPNRLIVWSTSVGAGTSETENSTGPDGRASVLAVLGGAVGSYVFTATVSGTALSTDFTATATGTGGADPTRTTISVDPGLIVAVGGNTSLITVQTKDAFDNLLTEGGDIVCLSTSLGSLSGLQGECEPGEIRAADQGDGRYTSVLGSSSTGLALIGGRLNGVELNATAEVEVVPGPAHRARVIAPAQAVAGVLVDVTVRLVDANGNYAEGEVEVCLTAVGQGGGAPILGPNPLPGTPSVACVTTETGAGGLVLEATKAETVLLLAESVGLPGSGADEGATIEIVHADPHHLRLTPSEEGAIACEPFDIEIQVVDEFDNPMETQKLVELRVSSAGAPEGDARIIEAYFTDVDPAELPAQEITGTTDAAGWAKIVVAFDSAGTIDVEWSSSELPSNPADYGLSLGFTSGSVSAVESEISASPTDVSHGGTAQIVVLPRDACGIEIGSGATVEIDSPGDAGSISEVVDEGDGGYFAVFTAEGCPHTVEIGSTVDGVRLSSTVSINTHCPAADPGLSTVDGTHDEVLACVSGGEHLVLEVVLFDSDGEPIDLDLPVAVEEDSPYVVAYGEREMIVDPVSGHTVHRIGVASDRCGSEPREIHVMAGGIRLDSAVSVTFSCPLVDPSSAIYSAEPNSAPADGEEEIVVTIFATDECGNPAFSRLASIEATAEHLRASVDPAEASTVDEVGSDLDGSASFSIRSLIAGASGAIAVVDGVVMETSGPDLFVFELGDVLAIDYRSTVTAAVVGQSVELLASLESRYEAELTAIRIEPEHFGLVTSRVEGGTLEGDGSILVERLEVGEILELRIWAQVRVDAEVVRSALFARYRAGDVDVPGTASSNEVSIEVDGMTSMQGCECDAGSGSSGLPLYLAVLMGVVLLLRPRRRGA